MGETKPLGDRVRELMIEHGAELHEIRMPVVQSPFVQRLLTKIANRDRCIVVLEGQVEHLIAQMQLAKEQVSAGTDPTYAIGCLADLADRLTVTPKEPQVTGETNLLSWKELQSIAAILKTNGQLSKVNGERLLTAVHDLKSRLEVQDNDMVTAFSKKVEETLANETQRANDAEQKVSDLQDKLAHSQGA